MNTHLFWLIHNERSWKRYYYQPLVKDDWPHRFLHHLRLYARVFKQSARLPFDGRLNVNQYGLDKSQLKPRGRQLWEIMLWAVKYKEVCKYYYAYGLDAKGKRPGDYVAYTEFRVLRNILNFRQRESMRTLYTFNYLALTRDKFVFYQYCKSLGMPFPGTIGLVSKGEVSWYDGQKMVFAPLESVIEHEFDGFCKEVNGESGRGAFCLECRLGHLYDRGEEITVDELRRRVGTATYIIQERLTNHPALNEIYPHSLNTIKLITFLNDDGEVEFFDSVLRFGAGGNFVDNASQGGVFVGIEPDGHLQDVGYHEPGTAKHLVVDGIHPDTNVRFGGMEVPFWNEILEASKQFHKFFYGVPSIGWDVAITPTGFVFTETGEDWEIPVYQVTHGGLREKYYRTHGKALKVRLRKY